MLFVLFASLLLTAADKAELQAVLAERVAKVRQPMSLQDKQAWFAHMTAKLILEAESRGYSVTLGEAWRSAEQAAFKTKINQQKGIGIAASLHTRRLAIDLNLFRNGKFLTDTADYLPLGEWWERQSVGEIRCRWGGRFKRADGNHFSFEHEGIQ
jgi:hypothetical protein